MREKNYGVISVVTVLLFLFLWWLVTRLNLVSPLFVPTPHSVWTAFIDILVTGYKGIPLWQHVLTSFYRLFVAFAIALVVAVPLGIVSGYSRKIQAVFDPFIEFYRPLPPLAYYTLLVLWLGIGNASKITLLCLAAFAPLYLSTVAGVRKVPVDRIHGALSLGANRYQLLRYVLLPSILPEIFVGIRTSIGVMYSTLVAAEMVAAVSGVGWIVLDASTYLRSDIIFVGILIMGIIAIFIDLLIRKLERRVVPWSGK